MSIGLFYGSTSGSTKKVAKMIAAAFGEGEVEMHDVRDLDPSTLEKYDTLILGTSTYGQGSLQEDWADFIWEMEDAEISGKTVALFCLGDQRGYPDSFVDCMSEIYEKVKELGCTVVGSWPTDGYEFTKSTAIVDGQFMGLVIDQDTQYKMTDERVKTWVADLKAQIG